MSLHAPMLLQDLLAPIGVHSSDARVQNLFVSELTLDSRAVQAGHVFVALQGSVQHGLQFAERAEAQGAIAILWESAAQLPTLPELSIPLIEVKHLRERLGVLATTLYRYGQALRLMGVTGTNGKTSCVQLLAQALCLQARRCGTIGTLGITLDEQHLEGARTTPDVLTLHRTLRWFAEQGASDVAMEVSSHALDQNRVAGAQFSLALFTNLTRDHLDYHHTMAAYGAAKAKLFARPELQHAVINIDDAFGQHLCATLATSVRAWRYGTHQGADFRADAIKLTDRGASFTLHTPDGEFAVQSPLLGRFNVLNLLGVIVALRALEMPMAAILAVIAKLAPVHGRMNKLGGGEQALVVVDYAHTPDALEQVLRSLREHTRGKLLCVFGCGGDRDHGKRPLMAAAVDQFADSAIVTNDNPRSEAERSITDQILPGFVRIKPLIEHRRERAIALAIAQALPGDVVLIAGKGHENYQEVNGVRLAFDDALVARAALAQREAA
jgi:UDP-N-acetylmuramoyl-L-alanyl-D-glutamate--2,6-diaminopimelate ligase